MSVAGAQKTAWKDPSTGETFIIDGRTGNFYPRSACFTVGVDEPIGANLKRRTLRLPQLTTEENDWDKNNTCEGHTPDWLREALQVRFLLPSRMLD